MEENKLVINGEVLDDFSLTIMNNMRHGNVEVVSVDVDGRDSSIYKRTELKATEETLEIEFNNKERWSNYKVYDYLMEVFKIGQESVLDIGFSKYGYYKRGVFIGPLELPADKIYTSTYRFSIGVKYLDPYWYSLVEYDGNFEEGELDVSYRGVEEGGVFKFTALKDSSYLSLMDYSDGRFFKIGNSVPSSSATQLLKLYSENSIDGWSPQGGDYLMDSGGAVSYDGEFYKVDAFGSSVGGYHSSSISRDLSEVSADFEVSAMFRTRDISPDKDGRALIVLMDSSGRELCYFGAEYKETHEDVRLGGKVRALFGVRYKDGDVVNESFPFDRTLDFSGDNFGRSYENSDVFIKITRTDGVYELKTWKYSQKDGRLTSRTSIKWSDREGKYDRSSVGKIGISFGKDSDKNAIGMGVSQVIFKKVNVGEARGSYFIKTGDEIVVDSTIDLVSVNGEPILEMKDVQSDFLTIKKGVNNYKVFPRDSFSGGLKFRGKKI